jgi:hypothetical protein
MLTATARYAAIAIGLALVVAGCGAEVQVDQGAAGARCHGYTGGGRPTRYGPWAPGGRRHRRQRRRRDRRTRLRAAPVRPRRAVANRRRRHREGDHRTTRRPGAIGLRKALHQPGRQLEGPPHGRVRRRPLLLAQLVQDPGSRSSRVVRAGRGVPDDREDPPVARRPPARRRDPHAPSTDQASEGPRRRALPGAEAHRRTARCARPASARPPPGPESRLRASVGGTVDPAWRRRAADRRQPLARLRTWREVEQRRRVQRDRRALGAWIRCPVDRRGRTVDTRGLPRDPLGVMDGLRRTRGPRRGHPRPDRVGRR